MKENYILYQSRHGNDLYFQIISLSVKVNIFVSLLDMYFLHHKLSMGVLSFCIILVFLQPFSSHSFKKAKRAFSFVVVVVVLTN